MEAGVRSIAIKFGLFGLIAILLFGALYNTMTNQVDGGTKEFEATFSNVSGLRSGDDVRISGVKVGRVESIEVQDNRLARVKFTVQTKQKVSDTTRLEMRYQNLLGQKYLALTPGSEPGTLLEDGAAIGLDRTSPGFDLTALLNGFEPLFNVLSPDDMNQLAENIVAVLQGEAGSVESLLHETAELTAFLADRDEVFGQVVENLTPVIENLSSKSTEFDTALVELKNLVTELNQSSDQFFDPLTEISANLESSTQLIEDIRPSLARDIEALRTFGATVRRGTPTIETSLAALPDLVSAFVRSQSYGSHLQVYPCIFGISLIGDTPLWLGPHEGPFSEACR